MEQYIHTVISRSLVFAPEPFHIQAFFSDLQASGQFRPLPSSAGQPALRVIKPNGRFRYGTDPFTGEQIAIPASEHIAVEQIDGIRPQVEGLSHYTVAYSGEWRQGQPFALWTPDGAPFRGSPACEVSCHLRPEPVSTSCWNQFLSPASDSVPEFGGPCAGSATSGTFSNPWTGHPIRVPDAGCARFWIELEFGRFLLPRVSNTFDLLDPSLLRAVEACFATQFVQGYRFN